MAPAGSVSMAAWAKSAYSGALQGQVPSHGPLSVAPVRHLVIDVLARGVMQPSRRNSLRVQQSSFLSDQF